MKTVTVTCYWKTHHDIEVPDDFTTPATLDGFPADALDEMTSETADLTDWEVTDRAQPPARSRRARHRLP